MTQTNYRPAIEGYIRLNAKPPDKFSHQARLYILAKELANGSPHDDDIIYGAAWLHDLGVFLGHRPEDVAKLPSWDCVGYAMAKAPGILEEAGFPKNKIPAVVEAIRTHQPSGEPTTFEGIVLREADILEQLGSVGILRTVSKVGRDTRFVIFSDALRVLQNNLALLPKQLKLERSRELARPKIEILEAFLEAASTESNKASW